VLMYGSQIVTAGYHTEESQLMSMNPGAFFVIV